MPYTPSQHYIGGQLIAQGFSNANEAIMKGVQTAMERHDQQTKELMLLDTAVNEAVKAGEPININDYMAGNLNKKREIASQALASINYRQTKMKEDQENAQTSMYKAMTGNYEAEARYHNAQADQSGKEGGKGPLGKNYFEHGLSINGQQIGVPGWYSPSEVNTAVTNWKKENTPDPNKEALTRERLNNIYAASGVSEDMITDQSHQHGVVYEKDTGKYRNAQKGERPQYVQYGDYVNDKELDKQMRIPASKGGVPWNTWNRQQYLFDMATKPGVMGAPGAPVTQAQPDTSPTGGGPITEADKPRLAAWLKKNPNHKNAPDARRALGLPDPAEISPAAAKVKFGYGAPAAAPTGTPSGAPMSAPTQSVGPVANPTPGPSATPSAAPIATPADFVNQGSGSGLAPNEMAILEWIRQHPDDPQAQALLEQLQAGQ